MAIRGAVETESLAVVEQLYLQARSSYFAGHPHVADDMFDRLEVRVSPSARFCGVSSLGIQCSTLRHTPHHTPVSEPVTTRRVRSDPQISAV